MCENTTMTESGANRPPYDTDVIGDVTDEFFGCGRVSSPQIRITPCDAPSPSIKFDGANTGFLGSDYFSDPDIFSGNDCVRRRALSCSPAHHGSFDTHLAWSRPLEGRMRIPRDPTQPSHGSISDVHSDTSADEDADHFEVFYRPRSRTCPEEIMRRRRSRMRSRDRPPTPPPGFAFACATEKRLCLSPMRDKNNAPYRSLPELPEFGALPPPVIVAERWNSVEDVGLNRCVSPAGQDWTARRVDEWMENVAAASVGTKQTATNDSKK